MNHNLEFHYLKVIKKHKTIPYKFEKKFHFLTQENEILNYLLTASQKEVKILYLKIKIILAKKP